MIFEENQASEHSLKEPSFESTNNLKTLEVVASKRGRNHEVTPGF